MSESEERTEGVVGFDLDVCHESGMIRLAIQLPEPRIDGRDTVVVDIPGDEAIKLAMKIAEGVVILGYARHAKSRAN